MEGLRPSSDRIEDDDRVLLYLDNRRTWLVQVGKNAGKFHTHAGIVELNEIVGKNFGEIVRTTLGENLALLRPTTIDYIMKSERRTQIVYPKDFAYISARSGLKSGSYVLECGTGSGGLTAYFASIIAPNGVVHTFEERSDFLEIAKKNVSKAGVSSNVKFESSDLRTAKLSSSVYDLVLLDLGDPWTMIDVVEPALRGSGFLFSICPTTNQLEAIVTSMGERYADIECAEILFRRIEARYGKTRPSMRMIGHTCYLASGRKLVR